MTFFDEQGNAIQYQQWLETYEPYYFLGGPMYGRRVNRRNQSSRFVEDQVCALLTKKTPLSQEDLILAMGWKIGGLIDQGNSEVSHKIEYLQDWPKTLAATGQYGTRDFSRSIPYLASNMNTILKQISQGNPRYLFDLVPQLTGFGNVYILTVLFFATHGRYPIYDRHAHVAAQAIGQDLRPGSHVLYKELQNWNDYETYMNLLRPISKADTKPSGDSPMLVSRPVDRALWVYGHFFDTGAKKPRIDNEHVGTRSFPPVQPVHAGGVLVGRICDLANATGDGWRRREINVKQGSNGYPAIRDIIHLIDSSGSKYPNLPFIKGARLPGHTCLGQPGALKAWFKQHYCFEKVESVNVYFNPTEQPNEYRICTETEWSAR
jgi:hypothetical protein